MRALPTAVEGSRALPGNTERGAAARGGGFDSHAAARGTELERLRLLLSPNGTGEDWALTNGRGKGGDLAQALSSANKLPLPGRAGTGVVGGGNLVFLWVDGGWDRPLERPRLLGETGVGGHIGV